MISIQYSVLLLLTTWNESSKGNVNERGRWGNGEDARVEMVKVDEFKYLEPTIQSYGWKERRRSGVRADL